MSFDEPASLLTYDEPASLLIAEGAINEVSRQPAFNIDHRRISISLTNTRRQRHGTRPDDILIGINREVDHFTSGYRHPLVSNYLSLTRRESTAYSRGRTTILRLR